MQTPFHWKLLYDTPGFTGNFHVIFMCGRVITGNYQKRVAKEKAKKESLNQLDELVPLSFFAPFNLPSSLSLIDPRSTAGPLYHYSVIHFNPQFSILNSQFPVHLILLIHCNLHTLPRTTAQPYNTPPSFRHTTRRVLFVVDNLTVIACRCTIAPLHPMRHQRAGDTSP